MSTESLLEQSEQKDLLRFITAGSVDDGKSTLIGRLLHDTQLVYDDHLVALKRDSKKDSANEPMLDFALLLDGLRAEREQGITIDVAYRYFSTTKRKFILADTPGHEQYTRNMVTGASTADLAVILLDARKGVLPQTKRHSFIASLLGIKHLVVAVNKMDLVDFDQTTFEKIRNDYSNFAARLEVNHVEFIPISAVAGDNVVTRSKNMSWYQGPSVLSYLENVHIASDRNFIDTRFPVQHVLRPNQDFRGYSGTLVSGILRKGDEVIVLPAGKTAKIHSIETFDGTLDEAFTPMAVTVTLDREIDVSRGNMLASAKNVPKMGRQFDAVVVWMAEEPMHPGNSYLVKQTTQVVPATIAGLRYQMNVNTLRRETSESLELNEIGRVAFTLSRPLMHDSYRRNRATGSFILIDRISNATVGAGMIVAREASEQVPVTSEMQTRESAGMQARGSSISKKERAKSLKQKATTLWLTGLPQGGKSSIAFALERELFDAGLHAFVLDGANFRLGMSKDLAFTGDDRSENVRRAAETAKLFNDAGMIAIAAFVSPFESSREDAKSIIGDEHFIEVHVNTPIEKCKEQDSEGLYEKAEAGDLRNFSGVNAPYEAPESPALRVGLHELGVEEAVQKIIALLKQQKII